MRFFLFIFILILLPIVSASFSEQIFDDYVKQGERLTIDGNKLYASYSGDGTQAFIGFNDQKVILENGMCKETSTVKICVDIEEDYIDYSIDKQIYKGKISIFTTIAQLNVTRTFSSYNGALDEEITVKLSLTNGLDHDATKVDYQENIPGSFIINSVDTCSLSNHTLSWTGDIKKENKITCEYRIIPQENGTFEIPATLNYYNGKEIVTDTEKEKITISAPEITLHIVPEQLDLEIGEKKEISFILMNTLITPITATSFDIISSPSLSVLSYPKYLSSRSEKYSWSGEIEGNSSKTISITVRGESEGNSTIQSILQYFYEGNRRDFTSSIPLSVVASAPLIGISLNKDRLNEGEIATLHLTLKNPSFGSLKDVVVNLNSSYPGISFHQLLPDIKSDETVSLYSAEISALSVSNDSMFTLSVFISYLSADGKKREEKTEHSFIILAKHTTPALSPTPEHNGTETVNPPVTIKDNIVQTKEIPPFVFVLVGITFLLGIYLIFNTRKGNS